MEKLKLTFAAIFTAFCWISLCIDWDLMVYVFGSIALIIIFSSGNKEKEETNIDNKIKD